MSKTALILVDLQNDYFPKGAFELVNIDQAAQNAARLLEKARKLEMAIFHVRHESLSPSATFFKPQTEGAGIHKSVIPQYGESIILKHRPNSFFETDLLEKLKGQNIDHLIICGAMSHMCIDATVRAAVDLGYSVSVAEDACASRDMAFNDQTIPAAYVHGAFMAALAMSYAKVSTSDDLLAKMA